ncbi:class I SAM-dependent methyltransferase [Microbacterium invictum]|uniref:SAM-dependent methyltransferase n=1 Tax=Microbacterium invictum TaxID=515415 RepID=A0AA40VMY0_9MICO|nr:MULTISPECIES: class I SAM-dependent methyltransferase [Microbacterium]MBB4139758.1 SAM-dependent methyltransferase [Microbacterium invictum]
MRANRRGIALSQAELGDADLVDIRFDDHRVWSVPVPAAVDGKVQIAWPAPIRNRLSGRTRLSVHDTVSGRQITCADVAFGRSRSRLAITDKRGQWLAMTKWDRLGPVLDGSDSDVASRLVRSARRLVDDLQAWGYPVYLVGGTLLGMVRGGELLPHDDDIDFAFLAESDDPAELGRISFDMERRLTDAGYAVARHSLAQLELVFFDEANQVDHYIDVFTGFFHEGLYCQPFALRSDEITADDLVPTRDIDVNGVPLPGPANPEAWLAYAYGENWRIPDPTFKFVVDRGTKQRFETWFGVFNRGRFFWEKHWQGKDLAHGSHGGRANAQRLLERMPPQSNVLDLGCGDGHWGQAFASAGHRVIGTDFSFEALRVARLNDEHDVTLWRINANDRPAMLELGANLVDTRRPWYVFCNDVIHGLTYPNRQNVFLLMRMVLRGQGAAVVSFDTHRTSAYVRSDPRTWHYPIEKFHRELAENGLVAVSERHGIRRADHGWRRTTTAVIQAAPQWDSAQDSWKNERDEDAR